MTRQSYTAVLEQDVRWEGAFETEPYECAWAGEALFFVLASEAGGFLLPPTARVQISPDGLHWCDHGIVVPLPAAPGLTHARVTGFGGWLRLAGNLPVGTAMRATVYLALKE